MLALHFLSLEHANRPHKFASKILLLSTIEIANDYQWTGFPGYCFLHFS